ncbi:uncharacterized protein LOC119731208 [Patiria miniata]|uniref:Potassium channel domain-containing protein n=1 Tax=Patiria miniata TaxID=46514 RepID=A0A914A8W7_PATMI|nr:uncharacterized protein LOC119731208 [Patiria miniata]
MFFQQTHTARNAVDEAEENELDGYYLDPPPWFIAGKKRMSTASAFSSRSRRSGGNISVNIPSPTASVELAQPSEIPPRRSGDYSRQTSAARSSGSLPARRGFASTKPQGNPVWSRIKMVLSSSLGLFLLIQTYLCIGAFCFMWLEADKEDKQMKLMANQRLEVAEKLVNCSGNVSCHNQLLRKWEKDLINFPHIYLEIDGQVWSWIYSYYCSFTIISTIGYGNVTPLSVFGRLFAVVYAVVGIPLMLLFITDIGNKFARWTKIAIIKFRKCKYKLCNYCQERRRNDLGKSNTGRDEAQADEGGGGDEVRDEDDGREVGGDASSLRDGGLRAWNIPEVHINIAMSTLDEEAWEMETKDIEGAVGEEERYHGYRDAGLHVCRDNSDYGGSSTGVEACIIDTNDNAPAIVPSATLEVPRPRESVTESIEDSKEVEIDPYLGGGEKLDSSPNERASDSSSSDASTDDVTVSVDTLKDNQPSVIEGADSRERGGTTVDNQQTDVTTSMTNNPESLGVRNDVCEYEPSDVLHTSPLGKETAIGESTCDKCGQPMQNARHVKTDDVVESECSNSAEEKGRKTELALDIDSRVVDSAITKTFSTDSLSMDIKTRPPLYESLLLRKEDEIPQIMATYFRHDSLMDDQHVNELSRQKSRSLEGINTFNEERTDTEPSRHRPAIRGTRTRRTSAPNVSFQTSMPKQNGRLPNRHLERCTERDDDVIRDAHEADDDADGDFTDKPATDSGVASSTSNSTECSPKRRPNSIHLTVGDSSDDNQARPDDVNSDDDVMDSEEEKSFEKLRQLRFGAARPSMIGRELMRVSEADIAMLSIPLWLALLLLLMYLLLGAGCFAAMQKWSFIDGFYYSFISLSTIGFGDLVFLPQNLHAGLIFSFLYSFVGLCFTSMCMSLSSMELTLLSRKIASKFGVYRGRIRSLREKRWTSRRRRAIRASSPER